MPWREWIPYHQGEEHPVRLVWRIDHDLKVILGFSTTSVFPHRDYATEAIHKHRLRYEHFQVIEPCLARGRVIGEWRYPQNLTFLRHDRA
jgi:hypothetical protein